jgi:RNase P subunit RPR2
MSSSSSSSSSGALGKRPAAVELDSISVMDVFDALPVLVSTIYRDVPAVVVNRLHYLWETAHLTVISSPSLSLSLAREFMAIVNRHQIQLPDHVKNRLCSQCSSVQLPTINSRIQVISYGKRKRKSIKYTNALVRLPC